MAETDSEPQLDKPRHIKYWQRCHSTYLPTAYTGNDSTRLTFAFFIYSSLDLLSVPLTDKDRAAVRTWVLSLQHPDGGFCGSPTHVLPGKDAEKGTPNLAATFFALLLLGIAAQEQSEEEQKAAFAGVDRKRLLSWLRRLQRSDGSFGQVLWDGESVGGRDMRHSYLAASIRWMLRGEVEKGDGLWEEDVDVDKMVEHIRGVQTYDGGLSESSQQESHAGYAYCAIAALALLDRQPSSRSALQDGIANRPAFLKWLAHRQFAYLSSQEEKDETEENYLEAKLGELKLEDGCCRHVGFNGRWNKKADTCYCWWVGGTLHLLDSASLFDVKPSRNYILEITQHRIGGFSKAVGGPPDIYHSYLGLAALSMMGEPDLKELDVGLCCSKESVRRIERAREGLLEGLRRQGQGQDGWGTDEFWGKTSGAT
ncbi:Geranylgeranyl transferase type-1 subunit beta-like protein [Cladobotryum mycophilum]|uniref:Geranylgeranyl transferase type-1 subunit beta n=1 Tax=Cladobotryum mycophilum TaxID=491253 RepID=A0ABR0SJ34_9HYPO